MRRPLFRLLACLLLALAVPVQGVAAVAAGVCMAFGEHEHGEHHHDEHAAADEQHAAGGHCAPCVSCCAAAAISPTLKVTLPESVPADAIAVPRYWIAGAPPDELDRPPLSL